MINRSRSSSQAYLRQTRGDQLLLHLYQRLEGLVERRRGVDPLDRALEHLEALI